MKKYFPYPQLHLNFVAADGFDVFLIEGYLIRHSRTHSVPLSPVGQGNSLIQS